MATMPLPVSFELFCGAVGVGKQGPDAAKWQKPNRNVLRPLDFAALAREIKKHMCCSRSMNVNRGEEGGRSMMHPFQPLIPIWVLPP